MMLSKAKQSVMMANSAAALPHHRQANSDALSYDASGHHVECEKCGMLGSCLGPGKLICGNFKLELLVYYLLVSNSSEEPMEYVV